MTITIYTYPILEEVRQKAYLGAQDIKDPESRDNARAGVEKTDEVVRCILEGVGQVQRRCLRFLQDRISPIMDDAGLMPEAYEFNFTLSERRAIGKAEPLTKAMHALVVSYALAKFYATVNQTELSNKHSLLALDAGNMIDELLFTKLPPRV